MTKVVGELSYKVCDECGCEAFTPGHNVCGNCGHVTNETAEVDDIEIFEME